MLYPAHLYNAYLFWSSYNSFPENSNDDIYARILRILLISKLHKFNNTAALLSYLTRSEFEAHDEDQGGENSGHNGTNDAHPDGGGGPAAVAIETILAVGEAGRAAAPAVGWLTHTNLEGRGRA